MTIEPTIGLGRVAKFPCTPEQQQQAITNLETNVTNLTEVTNSIIAGTSDHLVLGVLGDTPGVLSDKFDGHSLALSGTTQYCGLHYDAAGGGKLSIFFDAATITGVSPSIYTGSNGIIVDAGTKNITFDAAACAGAGLAGVGNTLSIGGGHGIQIAADGINCIETTTVNEFSGLAFGPQDSSGTIAVSFTVTPVDVVGIRRSGVPTGTTLTANASISPATLRRFKYTVNKAVSAGSATVQWLDDADNPIPPDQTVYDPETQFSGKVDGFAGESAFTGIALLRHDLASLAADRWEVVASEGLADLIYCTWYSVGIAHYVSNESVKDPWNRRDPVTAGGNITIADPASLLPSSPATGLKLLCRLRNPDTSPPTYDVVGLKNTELHWGTVTTAITGRTTPGAWGSGFMQLWNEDGSNDGAPQQVQNRTKLSAPIGADGIVDKSFTPPRIVGLTCT